MVDSTTLIDDFVSAYESSYLTWDRLAKFAKELCEKNPQRPAVQAIFSCRAKKPESLRNKLVQRNEDTKKWPNGYQTQEDIWEDIFDRAGVRIALYSSAQPQKATVNSIIESTFIIAEPPKHFPDPMHHSYDNGTQAENGNTATTNRFPGYTATHYRVYLREEHIKELSSREVYGLLKRKHMIEIQVVSLFQHAWAEVSHDILYKTILGSASEDERRVLDALNGVCMLGESLLEQLHWLYVSRMDSNNKPFKNKFELGSLLSKRVLQDPRTRDLVLGPIEILRTFLEVKQQNTPRALESILRELSFDNDSVQNEPAEGRASIYIIDQMLLRMEIPEGNRMDSKTQCSVLTSAMIWLDELFSPSTKWQKKLSIQSLSDEQFRGLVWLMNEARGFLLYDDPLSEEEADNLTSLWHWFQQHQEPIVRFTLRVSKVGILRNLENDSEKLQKIWSLIRECSSSDGRFRYIEEED